ncbi:DUF2479 domain-containing protein [Lactococcus lactis subsp. cremoris]|nr:BppU family phage baseplate upper protein [Lactococcus cremoris]MRM77562.1 DUF2479 domain-containing protein [Lactococcus cremoris]
MSDYSVTLSTTEPNNYVGLIKLRQGDVASQSIQATITANGQLFNFDHLAVFFNAVLPNGNVVRDKVTSVDYANSKLNYVVADSFLQEVAQVTAWFSFENGDKIIDSTKNFQYSVIAGWKESIPQGNYIYELSEIQREIEEIIGNKDFTSLIKRMDALETKTAYLDQVKASKADLDQTNSRVTSNTFNISSNTSKINSLSSGAPIAVSLVSKMTDKTKNYVYTGREAGYTTGNWYFWTGSAWASGGVYQSTGIENNYITLNMMAYKYLVLFRGGITIDFKNQLITFSNYDFIGEDGKTHFLFAADFNPSISISGRRARQLYHICAVFDGNGNISGLQMVTNDSIIAGAYIIVSLCDNTYYAPYIPKDLITIIDVNGRQSYSPKLAWAFINDVSSIIIDKKNLNITFPGSSRKVTITTIDYKAFYQPTNVPSISLSGLATAAVLGLYYDSVNNTFGVTTYNQMPTNVFIICTFKIDSPIISVAGNANAFMVYDANGNQEFPRETALPKTLNMPHYLPASNIENGFFTQAYFLGRWIRKTINGTDCMYTINLGSAIFAKLKGTTSISIGFLDLRASGKNPTEIAYSVDGGAYVRDSVDHAPFIVTLPDTKEHYIRIVIAGNTDDDQVWTSDQGIAFTGFTLNGGTSEPVKPKARIGLFYGDSITSGCWVMTRDTPSQGYAAEANYVEKCCELLRAINVRVAFSASGVTRGGAGGVPSMLTFIDNMDANTLEKSDVPDFIVVNMGTNDSAATSMVFQNAYQACINRIQTKYPGVTIFCMLPFNGVKNTEIQAVVNGSANTVFIDTTGWGVTYVDGIHPDTNGSITGGTKLAQFLVNYFGKSYFMV